MGLLAALTDFILPPTCAACGSFCEVDGLCAPCGAALVPLRAPLCECCGAALRGASADSTCGACLAAPPHYDRARACFVHEGGAERERTLSNLVYRYKYGRDTTLAPLFARLVVERCPLPPDHEVILPVPLHLQRLRWRGFNQALLLSRLLAAHWRVPVDAFELRRMRETKTQVGLADDERRRNLRGAFRLAGQRDLRGARVLLIDDVLTTGATVDECARVLKGGGAARVDVLVLARALMRN